MQDIIKEKHFKPKAHILTLLGEELIKSPVMAIYELVKNSYDADATKSDVYFRNIDNIENAAIIIEDDGIGMTSEIVEDVWLEPGSDFRKPVKNGVRQITKSPISQRIPMGEKGVGRFAVHKLGSKILLISRPLLIEYNKEKDKIISKKLANYEIEIFINWKDFNQSKHLSDIPIKWKIRTEKKNFRFKEKSGTYIHISGLNETWTKGMARDLKGQTLSMLSPKVEENSFKINLNFDNQWLVDFPSADKIIDEAPYKVTAYIDSKFNLIFEYDFFLKNNNKIGKREIKNDSAYNKNIKFDIKPLFRENLEKKEYSKEQIEILLNKFDSDTQTLPFGNIYIEFYSFDLDSISLRDYTNDAAIIKSILKEQAGIKVFKGDLRVFDYGEKGNDWLGLDLMRIQNKEWFSNNQNIGYIYLDAETSSCLVEKTNREGFIKNEAFDFFYLILEYLLTQIKSERLVDRNKWLNYNQKSSTNLFDAKISNFKALVEDADMNNDEKKKKILEEAEKLESKYEEDKKILLIPAGVGMTASVALHEIEKLVPRMEETVKSQPFQKEIITEQVEELKQYTEGIISVLRKGGDKQIDIKESINKAFSNYKLKLSDRKIIFEIVVEDGVSTINVDKRFFITMLMNIIDNSIYWLETVNKVDKGIYVNVKKENSSIIITIADNGPGFKDDISDLIRPYFSRKPNGIGIGLYLIDTIMLQYGKFEILNDSQEIENCEIPKKYDGAILKLVFSKNQTI